MVEIVDEWSGMVDHHDYEVVVWMSGQMRDQKKNDVKKNLTHLSKKSVIVLR